MISKIIGAIWLLFGIYWFIRPEALKIKFARKVNKKIKVTVFLFIFSLGAMTAISLWKVSGLIPKIGTVIGLIMAIKAIMLITTKSSEKFIKWWSNRPEVFFRVISVLFIIIGIVCTLT